MRRLVYNPDPLPAAPSSSPGSDNGDAGQMGVVMDEKRALVTGASSGIGKALARELAEDGYAVTGVARTEDALRLLVEELGDGHRYVVADLATSDGLQAIEREVAEGGYNVLVNSAGYAIYNRFEEVDVDRHHNLIDLNITALTRLSHAFLANARAGDALINLSSAMSRLSYPGGAVYCGSKAFVALFSESLWYEFKDRDIYVMALLPGLTLTNFQDVALDGKQVDLPTKLSSTPEQVAAEALAALKRRKGPTFIAGRRNRIMVNVASRILSRKKVAQILGKNNPVLD